MRSRRVKLGVAGAFALFVLSAAAISCNNATAPTKPAPHVPPLIKYMLTVPSTVHPDSSATVTVRPIGSDLPEMTYAYSTSGGTITGTTYAGYDSIVTWVAPSAPGNYTVTCQVTDIYNLVSPDTSVTIKVQ